jgi:hypothetical protein
MSTNCIIEKTFQPFPRLPLELRKNIWRLASLEFSSIIELDVSYDKISPFHGPPAIFSVNRELRQEAIKTSDTFSFYSPDDGPTQSDVEHRPPAVIEASNNLLFHPGHQTTHMYLFGHPQTQVFRLALRQVYSKDDTHHNRTAPYFDHDQARVLSYFARSLSEDQ